MNVLRAIFGRGLRLALAVGLASVCIVLHGGRVTADAAAAPDRLNDLSKQINKLALAGPAVERVANYDEALIRAKATGSDIVVFQRGSDWNRLGETLYNNVWMKPEFAQALGGGFILVAVDKPEAMGGRAVQGQCSLVYCGVTGLSDTQVGSAPPLRLSKWAEDATQPLPNEIAAVESKDGATFKQREDGAWLAQGATNPAQDTLSLTMNVRHGGQLLRLDFPPDAALPGKGPGRASNGNFVIGEVEGTLGKNPLKFTAAWASASGGNSGAWQVIDGVTDKGDNFWNPSADQHVRRTLLLLLDAPLPAGSQITVKLVCRSQHSQHVPGCVRGAVLSDAGIEGDVRTVGNAQRDASKNASFTWWDTTFCPRVALMDSAGRAVACENKPRLDLTPESLAARVKELRDIRQKRDELWVESMKVEGPERAEILRQSLDLLKIANWPGNGDCYKFIHEKIKAADPKDESGAVQWLSFGGHGRDGAPGMEAVWKALGEKQYEDAIKLVDERLADPRNKALDHDRIQRIMLAKFHIYRAWPDHQEQRFDVQRAIAALDPTTYLGIGAVGYLGEYHKTETPMLTYGWADAQIKAGLNVWKMTDNVAYFIDHVGLYQFTIAHAGGADTVKVKRIAVLDGDMTIAEAMPNADLGPGKNVVVPLDLKLWKAENKYAVRLEIESATDKPKNSGRISIEPLFQPPAADAKMAAAPRKTTSESDAIAKIIAKGDFGGWFKSLSDTISQQAGADGSKVLASAPLRASLAQAELVRACTPERLAKIAKAPGGAGFLRDFISDTDWLESFLNSGPSDRAQAIENLRFLYQYAAADFENPIHKRMATAMALQAPETFSRYRFFDRFKHIQRALQQGLMHIAFESYTVREMRWTVYLAGTARDYQYYLDDRQTTLGDYFGACWAIAYRDPNDYGYSVQGWGYVDPWLHHYGTGSGSRPLMAQRQVGGVCGTLSEYGATAANVHGIMSCTVGQPGHCAYVVRVGEAWGIGNDVGGADSTGFGAPGWDGTGYVVAATMWEPVEADREKFMAATRLTWLARLQLARAGKALGPWTASYEQAIAAQPLNYATWAEYIKALEATPDARTETFVALGKKAATEFAAYPRISYMLAERCYAKATPAMKPTARLAFLLEFDRDMRQDATVKKMGYNFAESCERQANLIGDPAMEMNLLAALLRLHITPTKSEYFDAIAAWGSNRFSAKPATAALYAKTMESFMTANAKAVDKGWMAGTISAGIRKASEQGDAASYKAWREMANRMLPPLAPEHVHLNAAQAAAVPVIKPFPGEVLSKEGMLQTSSACQFDRPLSYHQILTGGFGGWFDTNNQEKPWAQVVLPHESEVSGIVLTNRYEYAPTQDEFQWAAPLKVSVSLDGKTWTDVATYDKAEAVYNVDLKGKGIKARYVRIERLVSENKTVNTGRFHFRHFIVYGKPLPEPKAAVVN